MSALQAQWQFVTVVGCSRSRGRPAQISSMVIQCLRQRDSLLPPYGGSDVSQRSPGCGPLLFLHALTSGAADGRRSSPSSHVTGIKTVNLQPPGPTTQLLSAELTSVRQYKGPGRASCCTGKFQVSSSQRNLPCAELPLHSLQLQTDRKQRRPVPPRDSHWSTLNGYPTLRNR
ncbi:hypothetical protein CC78DRAFT_353288 [Lojkania enalia]|uniref:Uncharacterized protein n=1 Tax=Lojkania enalia TaxID=147567 RepID=A0A9P4N990_9PLEO|nr:hypothetical protein CC78DRAFT_353288 [Didymosphaeria enalia]